jgi:hypothetical protein
MTPIEALQACLLLFVNAMAAEHLIAPAFNTQLEDHKKVFTASYAQMQEALRSLVKLAIQSGDTRKGLGPMDLLRALVAVANVTTSPDSQQSARRLVDILVAG